MGRLAGADFGDDLHRLAGRLHAVHSGRADADALLPAALPQAVKLRAVQQLAEDQRDLLLENPGAVVLNAHFEPVAAGGFDVNPNLRQNACFLAGIERVVDRFLNSRQQRLARVVEAEQVAILGEEFADADVALFGRHRLRRCAAARRCRGLAILLNPLRGGRGDWLGWMLCVSVFARRRGQATVSGFRSSLIPVLRWDTLRRRPFSLDCQNAYLPKNLLNGAMM